MTIDERTRHDLHTAFDDLLGPDRAGALMSLLPPVGWADVATRHDLAALQTSLQHELRSEVATLRTEMNGRIDGLEVRFHQELTQATRTMVFSLTSSVFVVGSLAFAAASLV